MRFWRGRLRHVAFTAAVLATIPGAASAQDYPTRQIRFIMPFPAGGPADITLRVYGQMLTEDWKQPAVVENHPGATGTIGTEMVVKAAPDGYTLLFTVDLPIVMAPSVLKVPYDPQRDLIPVAAVVESENVLAVNASLGIHTLAELVAAAKAKPGTLTFSSAGNGSPAHLCGEMIKKQTGIDMTHVPFTGAAPAMNAVLTGSVTMFCGPIEQALPQIKAGTVVPLGVAGAEPSPLLPDVPPLSKSYPGLVTSNWFGLLAPAGTPESVIGALQMEFWKISNEPEIRSKLTAIGLRPEWIVGEALSKRIAADIVRNREFMTAANIHPE
jgi:tripartite-type tricarboxylate transporter receptor subunit TctC